MIDEHDFVMPADLVAEHLHILEHGQADEPPIRLRAPGPGPSRAQVIHFLRGRALRRARALSVCVLRHRRLAGRRAPRGGAARRPSRPPASTSRAAPEPPAPVSGASTSPSVGRRGQGRARPSRRRAGWSRPPSARGGDVGSALGARLLAGAAGRWRERGGGAVSSFTHAWREVPREAWGPISGLASVERPEAIEAARAAGSAAAIVVDKFASDEAFSLSGSNTKIVPCPAETRGETCVECRLCLDADKLAGRDVAIALEAHGPMARRAREALVQQHVALDEAHGEPSQGW